MSRKQIFAADLAKVQERIEAGGYVLTMEDGFQCLAPNTPEDLASAYNRLMQFGYANGLAA